MQINPNLEIPSYYNDVFNYRQVSMIAKLRVSMHNLKIEMGRRTRTERGLRLCYCQEGVEDEIHFLKECPLYQDIRQKYRIVNDTKLCELLNSKRYISYIEELYKHRSSFGTS